MNAVSSPICIWPLSTRWAPNHSTATVEALKMIMTIGKTSAMSLPTARAVPVYCVLASAKRARSWSSRTKARTTRMPVICSRSTRFTQSTDSCMMRKLGIILRMTRATLRASRGTATATSQDSPTSSRTAMTMPPTIMIGADTIIAAPMKTTVCTWVTSLVLREMSVGAPKRDTSCAEKSPTRAKIPARRSRPMPAAARAPR